MENLRLVPQKHDKTPNSARDAADNEKTDCTFCYINPVHFTSSLRLNVSGDAQLHHHTRLRDSRPPLAEDH